MNKQTESQESVVVEAQKQLEQYSEELQKRCDKSFTSYSLLHKTAHLVMIRDSNRVEGWRFIELEETVETGQIAVYVGSIPESHWLFNDDTKLGDDWSGNRAGIEIDDVTYAENQHDALTHIETVIDADEQAPTTVDEELFESITPGHFDLDDPTVATYSSGDSVIDPYLLVTPKSTDVYLLYCQRTVGDSQKRENFELVDWGKLTLNPPQATLDDEAFRTINIDQIPGLSVDVCREIIDKCNQKIAEHFTTNIEEKIATEHEMCITKMRTIPPEEEIKSDDVREYDITPAIGGTGSGDRDLIEECKTIVNKIVEEVVREIGTKYGRISSNWSEDIIIEIFKSNFHEFIRSEAERSAGFKKEMIFVELVFEQKPWLPRALEFRIHGGMPWMVAQCTAIIETIPGLRNKDIAEQLDIDDSTVVTHIDNVRKEFSEAKWLANNDKAHHLSKVSGNN